MIGGGFFFFFFWRLTSSGLQNKRAIVYPRGRLAWRSLTKPAAVHPTCSEARERQWVGPGLGFLPKFVGENTSRTSFLPSAKGVLPPDWEGGMFQFAKSWTSGTAAGKPMNHPFPNRELLTSSLRLGGWGSYLPRIDSVSFFWQIGRSFHRLPLLHLYGKHPHPWVRERDD